jgi:hypothetical protein
VSVNTASLSGKSDALFVVQRTILTMELFSLVKRIINQRATLITMV